MSYYIHTPLIALFFNLFLIFLVLRKDHRSSLHQAFSLFLLGMGLWGLAIFGMRSSIDLESALKWDKAVIAMGLWMSVFFYHFSFLFTRAKPRKWLLPGAYLLCILISALAPTDLVFKGMQAGPYGYAPIIGVLGYPSILAVYLFIILGLANLVSFRSAVTAREERNRATLIIAGVACGMLGGVTDVGHAVGIPILPLGMIGNILFASLATIAILRYQFLDIQVVIRRGLAYTIVSGLVVGIYVLIVFLISGALQLQGIGVGLSIMVILALAFALHPILHWVQRLVDRWFYRDRYDYLKALEQFSHRAQSIVNLEELCSTLTRLVSGALHTSSACLLLLSESDNGLVEVASTGLGSPPSGVVLRNRSPLVKWLNLERRILSSEEFNTIPQLQSLSLREKNDLNQMRAKLCVPIQNGPGQLVGILVLGQKLSWQSYSAEDRRLLIALGSQMSIALENARLYGDALQARRDLEIWLNSMIDYIMIVNTAYTIQFLNKAAIEKFGTRIGEKCWQALGKDAFCSSCPIQHYLRGNREGLRYTEKIGYSEYEVAIAPLLNPDGNLSVIEVLRDITERKRTEEELESSREQLRDLARHMESARETERTRIARELHDEMGQVLTALKIDLSWLSKTLSQDQISLREKTTTMSELTDTTISMVKTISAELRPGILDDLGLTAAIEWQAEEFQKRTGIECQLQIEPEDITPDALLSTAIFRILQESLTNVARHAQAPRVKVSLREAAGKLVLKVRDNGRGISKEELANPKSLGLLGMRERLLPWHGEVRIRGIEGKGTTVTASVPLKQEGETP